MRLNSNGQMLKNSIQKLIPDIIMGSFELTDAVLNHIPKSQLNKLNCFKDNWIVVFALPIIEECLWMWYSTKKNAFLFADFLLDRAAQNSITTLHKKRICALPLNDIVGQNISLVELAVLARLGHKGLHNLLIHPVYGAWLQLNAIIVTEAITFDNKSLKKNICNECESCLDACPVGALSLDSFEVYSCSLVVASPTKRMSKAKALTTNSYVECNKCIAICPIGKTAEEIYEWKQN